MIGKLEEYYKNNGILSTNFTCVHKDSCSKDCEGFTGPKSTYISSGYERAVLPRLLFLSLDSGSGDKIDENRLPLAVREFEEGRDVMALAKNKHWYRTHELAWYILKRFDPNLKIEETKGFFAHVNSAKCCMNNPQRKQAKKVLFRNCRQYLKSELDILKPVVLVTQGNWAREAIAKMIESRVKSVDNLACIIRLNDREVFWLHTYHPSCWRRFYPQMNINKQTLVAEGWEFYAKHIYIFISSRHT